MAKEQLEKLSAEYQTLQEQLQSLAIQKAQFNEQKEEFKEAAEELERSKGKVYSSVGGILIETTKEEAGKDLKERQGSVDMRLSIINKQYDEAVKKEKQLREEIERILKGEGAPKSA